MPKIIKRPIESINNKTTSERVFIARKAIDNLKKNAPSPKAFINLEPYNNISRVK
ncbi:hypothetical protein NQU17_02585 [Clostridiaceae bacterium HFYG-1003]|nr:hypothetical protein NQU17_08135 [Clostridiaceae bacterium HFYG-1003]UUM12470.1 hypothetical protein NQU17_02585 [Clostridiaceae bacterium HFYG-1003]